MCVLGLGVGACNLGCSGGLESGPGLRPEAAAYLLRGLGMLLPVSEPQFPHVWNGRILLANPQVVVVRLEWHKCKVLSWQVANILDECFFFLFSLLWEPSREFLSDRGRNGGLLCFLHKGGRQAGVPVGGVPHPPSEHHPASALSLTTHIWSVNHQFPFFLTSVCLPGQLTSLRFQCLNKRAMLGDLLVIYLNFPSPLQDFQERSHYTHFADGKI